MGNQNSVEAPTNVNEVEEQDSTTLEDAKIAPEIKANDEGKITKSEVSGKNGRESTNRDATPDTAQEVVQQEDQPSTDDSRQQSAIKFISELEQRDDEHVRVDVVKHRTDTILQGAIKPITPEFPHTPITCVSEIGWGRFDSIGVHFRCLDVEGRPYTVKMLPLSSGSTKVKGGEIVQEVKILSLDKFKYIRKGAAFSGQEHIARLLGVNWSPIARLQYYESLNFVNLQVLTLSARHGTTLSENHIWSFFSQLSRAGAFLNARQSISHDIDSFTSGDKDPNNEATDVASQKRRMTSADKPKVTNAAFKGQSLNHSPEDGDKMKKHPSVLHCGILPENIVLEFKSEFSAWDNPGPDASNYPQLKLTNFNEAVILPPDTDHVTKAAPRKFSFFSAPEQLLHGTNSLETETWQIGATIFYIAHGGQAVPAVPPEVRQIRSLPNGLYTNRLPRQYSQALNNLVMRCLSIDPKQRPTTEDLCEDVAREAAKKLAEAGPPSDDGGIMPKWILSGITAWQRKTLRIPKELAESTESGREALAAVIDDEEVQRMMSGQTMREAKEKGIWPVAPDNEWIE